MDRSFAKLPLLRLGLVVLALSVPACQEKEKPDPPQIPLPTAPSSPPPPEPVAPEPPPATPPPTAPTPATPPPARSGAAPQGTGPLPFLKGLPPPPVKLPQGLPKLPL